MLVFSLGCSAGEGSTEWMTDWMWLYTCISLSCWLHSSTWHLSFFFFYCFCFWKAELRAQRSSLACCVKSVSSVVLGALCLQFIDRIVCPFHLGVYPLPAANLPFEVHSLPCSLPWVSTPTCKQDHKICIKQILPKQKLLLLSLYIQDKVQIFMMEFIVSHDDLFTWILIFSSSTSLPVFQWSIC